MGACMARPSHQQELPPPYVPPPPTAGTINQVGFASKSCYALIMISYDQISRVLVLRSPCPHGRMYFSSFSH